MNPSSHPDRDPAHAPGSGRAFLEAGAAPLATLLAPEERALADAFPTEKRRADWTLGRAAAKAAVRALLAAEGLPVPAAERVVLLGSESGAPRLRLDAPDAGAPIVVSLTHGHGHAAAWALRSGPVGGLPGVDLEQVRPRKEGTLRFYLSPEERERVLALAPGRDDAPGPRDDLAIRLWAVKEAAFKALQPPRGMGLLDVRAEVDEDGRAAARYVGKLEERAAALGVREVRAAWERRGDLILAWVEAVGASL